MVRIRPVTENDRGNQDVTVHRQEVGKETARQFPTSATTYSMPLTVKNMDNAWTGVHQANVFGW